MPDHQIFPNKICSLLKNLSLVIKYPDFATTLATIITSQCCFIISQILTKLAI